MSILNPEISITNASILDFFNFRVLDRNRGRVRISQPLSVWIRCFWWKFFPPEHPTELETALLQQPATSIVNNALRKIGGKFKHK